MLLFPFQASARYDPAFQWYTVRTDHFIIYYPKGHELVAQRVLSLCEKVHKDITGYLGVEPRPCPIVLDPGTDIFNGYLSLFPSRISLYETPLYSLRGIGPGSDLLDLVFTHEYTHYVHITTSLGWYFPYPICPIGSKAPGPGFDRYPPVPGGPAFLQQGAEPPSGIS